MAIIKQPCLYCGVESKGIDRLDNKIGYTIENSRPCCTRHNIMKMALEVGEFSDDLFETTEYMRSKELAELFEKMYEEYEQYE